MSSLTHVGSEPADQAWDTSDVIAWGDLWSALCARAWLILSGAVLAGILGYAASFLLPTLYAAQTVFLAPQGQKGSASAALSALGSLGALAGVSGGATPTDQYVALMQSRTASDQMIDKFDLTKTYGVRLRTDARKKLATLTSFGVGKKDGLITVVVQDEDPQRAARMANHYVDLLRGMNAGLALTEAQQRRKFFEGHLEDTRDKLLAAQQRLQASGFSQGALQAEPKAAAETYAKLKAEVTAAEVKLQSLQARFAPGAPELHQQAAAVSALRGQLARLESSTLRPASTSDSDYVSKLRDFKYQETLFEMYARQFELARVDESREAALIQVVDQAVAPEIKASPSRAVIAGAASVSMLLLLSLWSVLRRR